MSIRDRSFKLLMVVVAAAMFYGASRMQDTLNVQRQKEGFTTLPVLSNAPPLLAFTTVALGGFRGLIANALWIRASELQDQERYFEMVQLADWITTLEPHYSTVWTHQAWNMAYNISVKCKDFEDRWRWVQRGIQLLHKGLDWNPGDVDTYKELSWIIRHKIGQNLDDAHMTYKLHWAQMMQDVLGGHPDFAALLNPQTPEQRERVRKLRQDYHMDPAFVQEIDKKFGPLDWRLPEAHSIYWSEMGVRNGTAEDKELIERFAYSLMQQACKRGGSLPPWVTNVTKENFILWPNLALVTNCVASFERVAAKFPEDKKYIVLNAEKNFLKEEIVVLYEYDRSAEANYWFNYLRDNITNSIPDRQLTMEEFALGTIQSEITELDPVKTTAFILGLITQEYLFLLGGEEDHAANVRNLAATVWRSYQSRLPEGQNGQRISLLPLPELRDQQLRIMETWISPQSAALLRNLLGKPRPGPVPPPAPQT